MDARLSLMENDKEKLVDEILDLRRENETLRQELEKLKQKSPAKSDEPKQAKASAKKFGKPPHLWGRKKGHPGSWRPAPDHIDRDVTQALTACPIAITPWADPPRSLSMSKRTSSPPGWRSPAFYGTATGAPAARR